ncbi:hypothetical protein BC940DRAFT_331794 [Gongronella butleri]|nr:hypothetical protein BC940DRAFT_331794 [Gongronella butleri]
MFTLEETDFFVPGVMTQCLSHEHFALTFDDGPYEYTQALINMLASYNATATLFINGKNNWQDPSKVKTALRSAYDAGLEIASHTYTHPHLDALTDAQIADEMQKNEKVIYDATGKIPAVMRPPFGRITEPHVQLLNRLGYTVVGWNIAVMDWMKQVTLFNEINALDTCLSIPNDSGYIFLAHDSHRKTVSRLVPSVLKLVKDKNLKLVTVSECLGIPAYKQEVVRGVPDQGE